MTLTITPAPLSGAITPPSSKSQGHRFLIAAALAEGDSLIAHLSPSQDIAATRRCLEELGASFEDTEEGVLVHGMGAGPMSPLRRMALPHLDCGESGSTLRFLIPVALAVRGGGVFTGHGRLMERSLQPYALLFAQKGIFFEQKDGVLTVQGTLEPGIFELPGNVSSQFFSGFLFALPLLGGPSAILPTTQLESAGYIALTAQALERFGVRVAATMSLPPQYHIFENNRYAPARVTVEPDWSQAAFWYVCRALGSPVEPQGMAPQSLQGDRVILEYCQLLQESRDVTLDVSQCPDLVPPLAALAALRPGKTVLSGARRLRDKESDRLSAVSHALNALGAHVVEGPDFLEFQGVEALRGGEVDPRGDHRIAMMTAIAATRAKGPVVIHDPRCVDKSYPRFWEDYRALGGIISQD